MREQHLDPNGVEIGNLIPLATRGPDQRNLDYGAALCTALNDWQLEYWLNKELRLRGSMLVPHEDPSAAVAEIERRASDDKFVQVLLPPRTDEPLGRRRYWPIFAAAVAAKRPSPSTSAARAGMPPPAAAGPPTTWRSTTPTCRPCRPW